ncbi:MAG TPA: PAS domain S-box protein, partial [Candidatus Thermoplasmatota archaeon]|nr:PAS domain S-box protein [Candidatus Thermoplasmatota archaeon]
RDRRTVEAAALAVLVVAACIVTFGPWAGRAAAYFVGTLVLPLLLWAAVRFGPRGATAAVAFVAAAAIASTVRESGPFPRPTDNDALLFLQFFLVLVALAVLALGALRAEEVAARPPGAPSARSARRTVLLAAITLAPLVAGTVLAGNVTASFTADLAAARLDEQAADVRDAIDAALARDVDSLTALRAYLETEPDAGRAEFARFIAASGEPERSPGVQGLSFVRLVEGETGGTDYVVELTEPFEGGEPSLVLDEARRAAVEAALAFDASASTPPVSLVHGPDGEPAFVIALAVRGPDGPIGLVDSVHRVGDLVGSAVPTDRAGPAFELRDVVTGDTFYRSDAWSGERTSTAKPLSVQGQRWDVVVESSPGVLTPFESTAPWLVLGAAGGLSLLATGLVYSASATGRRAEGIAQAMTVEIRRSRDELARSESSLAEAQRIAQIGSFEWDLRSNRLTWSAELYRIFGRDPGRFVPTYDAYVASIHPEDRARVDAAVRASSANGERFAHEYRIVRPDGGGRVLHSQAQVTRAPDGRPLRMFGTCQDVTARAKAEARFRQLLDAAPDAIVIADARGRIVLANAQAERLFGYAREELQRMAVEELMPQRFRDRHVAHREGYAAHEHPHARPMGVGLELLARAKDGREFPVEVSLSPLETEEGRLVSSAIRDISERKRSQAQLEEAERQLAVSEKLSALGTLVAGIGHEIRTPLTYITTRVALVERAVAEATKREASLAPLEAEVERNLASVKEGVWRIDRIVQQLRRFTRTEMSPVATGLHDVVDEAVELFRAANKGTFTVETDLRPTPPVDIDKGQMQQVVINLLNNAAEAQPAGGVLRVRTRLGRDHAEIEVEDEGRGIPPELHGRVFDPFFTTKEQGTGLGLSISRRIVEAHGGRLSFITRPGHGTTFTIVLPFRKAAAA